MNIGDRYEYKGNHYHYLGEIKVKIITLGFKSEWVTYVEYYNSKGKFAREKEEFFKRFKPC